MIKIRPLSRREKLISVLTLVMGISVLTFNLFINPMMIKLSGINRDIEQKTALLDKYSQLISQGENILARYDNYKDIVKKESHAEEVVSSLFEEIENIAESLSLPLETIKPLPLLKKKEYKEAFLEVELKGDFGEIFRFINKVENSPAFIRVSNLRLSPQSVRSSQLRCKITLSRLFL